MLVLTRRSGEWVSIGDSVTVKVLSVRGDQVQLGIEAPRTLRVDRGEIRARILAEMESARRSASDSAAWERWLRRHGRD